MECPKCLGSKIPMESKEKHGFEYKKCNVCEGKGVVLPELHQSFVDSIRVFESENTDNVED